MELTVWAVPACVRQLLSLPHCDTVDAVEAGIGIAGIQNGGALQAVPGVTLGAAATFELGRKIETLHTLGPDRK